MATNAASAAENEIAAELRAHADELRCAGVTGLRLIGSHARGTARPDSDVDLVARLDDARRLDLLDFMDIQERVAAILGRKVDLISERALRNDARRSSRRDSIRIF